MAPAWRGVLDTSIFIALETAPRIEHDRLPDEGVVTAITVAELHAGVLAARDVETRARRMGTLESIADVEVLGVDADVAAEWARLRVHLAEAGRRMNVNDLWIAATAVANGLPVVTQDDDFSALDGIAGVRVVRV